VNSRLDFEVYRKLKVCRSKPPDLEWWIWKRVPGPDNPRNGVTTGWAPATLDLRPYRGQMVTLSFRLYSRADNWYNTYVYIDDVQIVR
jgi:hypothetical protein